MNTAHRPAPVTTDDATPLREGARHRRYRRRSGVMWRCWIAALLLLNLLHPSATVHAQEATATPPVSPTPAQGALDATSPITGSRPMTSATGDIVVTEVVTAAAPLTSTGQLTASLAPTTPTAPAAAPITDTTATRIEQILAGMSAADRVGQLFVVTFRGADTSFESAIAELIYAYRIGGVVLSPENGNFGNEPGADTARQVAVLANKLQGLAYGILLPDEQALQPVPNEPWPPGNLVSLEREIGVAPPNLPLLVGVEQLGDNLPGTALRRGFSPLPSQLAVGSTWDPATAQLVGATVGSELRAVGINLLLGPMLDVIDIPRSDEVGSLSVHSFGGDPTWVGRMGRAYITGVHEGSEGRVATVARHFPGQGDVDRMPEFEVATIQRTQSELEQVALPPFWAVTRPQATPQTTQATAVAPPSPSIPVTAATALEEGAMVTASITPTATLPAETGTVPATSTMTGTLTDTIAVPVTLPRPTWVPLLQDPAITDIVMSSQMRYAALQPPGSPIAPLGQAPELPALLTRHLGGWLNSGGLVMSGPLGVPAIRRSYAPALDEFPARRIALDAFVAGNDLLYLSHFALEEDWEQQLDNYRAAIAFFQERYRAEPDFAARVDNAVRRILRLKLRLYERIAPAIGRPLMPPVPLSQLLVQESDLRSLPGTARNNPDNAAAPPTMPGPAQPPQAAAESPSESTTESGAAGTAGADQTTPAPTPAPEAPPTATAALPAATPPDFAAAQTARKAISILFPDPASVAPPPPQAGERIVIISDSRLQRECPTCTTEAAIDPDAIARTIISLYGPEATGQINPSDLTSLTFSDLAELLPPDDAALPTGTPAMLPTPASAPTEAETEVPLSTELLGGEETTIQAAEQSAEGSTGAGMPVARAIAEADWLVFALLDPSTAHASSNALHRYLRTASRQMTGQRIVVFALNGPSFLDATEISKLTLYLGVYSKAGPFLEAAVRALFRSITPEGSPAVSVPGTRFTALNERLMPDPAQMLPLQVRNDAGLLTANAAALATGPEEAGNTSAVGSEIRAAVVNMGSSVQVGVGPVLDHNGHPVPDGTLVNFAADFEGAELALTIPPATTVNGSAVRDVVLERSGTLRITALSGAASSGDPVLLSILEPQPEAGSGETMESATDAAGTTESGPGEATAASGSPESAATDSAALAGAPEAAPSTVLTPTTVPEGSAGVAGERVNLFTLLLSLLTMLLSLSLLLLAQIRVLPRETLFKSLIWAVIVGLAGYLLYAAGWLPGSNTIAATLNTFGAPLVVFLSMLLPLFWLQLRSGGER